MKNWFKIIHDWSLKWANTKWGGLALFICAFADASIFPLPTPMFFIALSLLNISKAYRFALFGTLGTMLGAIAGYSIGHFAWLNINGDFTGFAQFFIKNIPGFSEEVYSKIQIQFTKWDFWILFIGPFIPVPYKIFSITSGIFDINIFVFCFATLIGQGIRFYVLAFLLIKIGKDVIKLIEFNFKPVAISATVFIVISIFLYKFM